jgi:cytochrome c oxidase assembly protein subunit 15
VTARASFHRFSLLVLAATLGVILWGAYVRASGSGAGCGSHWPTCNGQIIPRSPGEKTVIEFTHRVSSGAAFLLVAVQLIWAFRAHGRRHPVRRAAVAGFALMISEALVGAGLVIFEMVASNPSIARGAWMATHLLNTFALLAALGLVCWRSRSLTDVELDPHVRPFPTSFRPALAVGLAAMLLVAMAGAIVALGDTLFPSSSLAHGLAQDLSPTAHLFIRLRVVHPILAVLTAIYLLVVLATLASRDPAGPLRSQAMLSAALVLAQVGLGFLNFALLAPVVLQILHLLLADLLWLSLVVVSAAIRERRLLLHRRPASITPLAQPSASMDLIREG